MVEAETIIAFKRNLDRYMARNGLERYGSNAGSCDNVYGAPRSAWASWAEGSVSVLDNYDVIIRI